MVVSARRRMGLVGALAALLVLAAFLVIVTSAKPVSAAANGMANGTGTTTQFRCPNGTLVSAEMFFFATKSNGQFTDTSSTKITDDTNQGAYIFTGITDGNIDNGTYTLSGSTIIDSEDACGGPQFTRIKEFTLKGQCGTAVDIHYSDSLGARGDFIGDVTCT